MEEEIRDEASSGGQQQRRQRIYEPQFNLPHPETSFKKKKIQFGSESHGLVASSPLADKLDRNWIGVTESSGRTIHKEITSPMAPRNLWRTASREDEGGEGDEAMMIQKENISPPSSPVHTMSLLSPDNDESMDLMLTPVRKGKPMEVTPTSSSESSTPKATTRNRKLLSTVTPLTTQKYSSNPDPCSILGSDKEDQGIYEVSRVPSLDDSMLHFESHHSLQQFLKDCGNEALQLYIDDYQDTTFDRIVESMYGNGSIETLLLARSTDKNFRSYKTRKEMTSFWEAIRCLPKLSTIMLMNLCQDVFMDLAVFLRNHPTLTHVQLHLYEGTIHPFLLDSLTSLPELTHIRLDVHETLDVANLLSCPKLQEIKICGKFFSWEHSQIESFIEKLETSPQVKSNLTYLDLEPTMQAQSFLALVRSLGSNTILQTLRVSVGGDGEDAFLGDSLRQLIQTNSTLTHIWNYSHESIELSSETMDNLVEALKHNVSLQQLQFFQEEPVFWAAKERVLKRNRQSMTNPFAGIFQDYFSCGSLTDAIHDEMPSYCVNDYICNEEDPTSGEVAMT